MHVASNRRLAYIAFFISGACALIYQVCWVRQLTLSLGATVFAVSIVLTGFMAGLAAGSYLFGRMADKTTRWLLGYGLVELALAAVTIGLLLAQPQLQATLAWLQEPQRRWLETLSPLAWTVGFFQVFAPSLLIGGTFPLLGKHVATNIHSSGRGLSTLYAANSLGAVAGCLAEAYWLTPTLGIRLTIGCTAATAGSIGLLAVVIGRRPASDWHAEQQSTGELQAAVGAHRHGVGWLMVVAFTSGFIVLAVEVLWTRLLINLLTGNVLVYATVLAGFLSGIAFSSFIVARLADRPSGWTRGIAQMALLSALMLAASVFTQHAFGHLIDWLQRTGSLPISARTYICLGIVFCFVALAATPMCAIFPILLRELEDSLSHLGRRVGGVYAANTVGAIAGSALAGFVLIPLLGTRTSLLGLALLNASGAVLITTRWRPTGDSAAADRLIISAGVVVGTVLAVVLMIPSARRPIHWLNLGFAGVQAVAKEDSLSIEEGLTATVGVARVRESLALTVNGLVVAETTKKDLWDLLFKAHLPMLLHKRPQTVCLVGLGGGISLGAIEAYDTVQQIDCIEISPEVQRAHKAFASFNQRSWQDPRLRLVINDGRHHLMATDTRYDVISVDPIDPPVCNLYTQDFFQLCHDRLKHGGLMVQWLPLFRLSAGAPPIGYARICECLSTHQRVVRRDQLVADRQPKPTSVHQCRPGFQSGGSSSRSLEFRTDRIAQRSPGSGHLHLRRPTIGKDDWS